MKGQPDSRRQAVGGDATVNAIESALYVVARRLTQGRLHDYFARQAGVDIDRAGLAILYILGQQTSSPRITDMATWLTIDAPAVTRKAQQLERLGLVSRCRDSADARTNRLQLTADGHRVLHSFRNARDQWLAELLAEWPPADRSEFAPLLTRFSGDIHRHLDELNLSGCPRA